MSYRQHMNNEIYTGYFSGDTKMNADSAESYCNSFGSNLATITSATELAAAQDECDDTGGSCWIGLYKSGTEWYWRDGSNDLGFGFDSNDDPISGEGFWYTDEPNNAGSGEGCGELRSAHNYYVNDISCSTLNYPLCNN